MATKRERSPGVWELRVYLGKNPHTNRTDTASRTFHGTEREASAALLRFDAEMLDRRHATIDVRTVAELADFWLTHLRAVGRANATIDGYRNKLTNHVLPGLGSMRVEKVSAFHLDRLYGEMTRTGLVRSVPQVHAVVRSMLSQAVKWGLVEKNAAKQATLPHVAAPAPWAPPDVTVVGFLEAVAERDPDLGAYLLLTADLGARRGEPLALRWSDVRWDDLEVDVSATVEYTSVQRAKGSGPELKPTKTHAAGVIPVGAETIDALRHVQVRQREAVKRADVIVGRDAFVFADLARDLTGGVPWRPDRVTGAVRRLRARPEVAGLPEIDKLTVKSLRHFMCTSLAARGMMIEAQKRARHRSIVTTNRYTSVVEARKRESADVMADVLRFPGTPDPSPKSSLAPNQL